MAKWHSLRPKQLRAFHQAVDALETEISCGATPLPQALAIASTGVDLGVGEFFLAVAGQISGGIPASAAWQKCSREMAQAFCLAGEDWKIIEHIGIGLGTTDRVEEKKKLRLGCARLQAAEEKASEQSRKFARLWSYMGFLAGATIALLIW